MFVYDKDKDMPFCIGCIERGVFQIQIQIIYLYLYTVLTKKITKIIDTKKNIYRSKI